jgi:hypothetical protein
VRVSKLSLPRGFCPADRRPEGLRLRFETLKLVPGK